MAQNEYDYMYLHGEAWWGDRAVDGTVPFFESLPEIDEISLTIATEKLVHKSKRRSMRLMDLSVPIEQMITGVIKFATINTDTLKQALFGAKAAVGAGTLTGVSLGTVEAGKWYKIPGDYRDITLTFIKDSTGSPITLVKGTDYDIDLSAGMVKCILATGTMPWLVTGTAGAGTGVGIGNERKFEKWLRFKGINVADGDRSITADLYRIQIDPAKTLQLMGSGNEVTGLEIEFACLNDGTKSPTATFGQQGDIKFLT